MDSFPSSMHYSCSLNSIVEGCRYCSYRQASPRISHGLIPIIARRTYSNSKLVKATGRTLKAGIHSSWSFSFKPLITIITITIGNLSSRNYSICFHYWAETAAGGMHLRTSRRWSFWKNGWSSEGTTGFKRIIAVGVGYAGSFKGFSSSQRYSPSNVWSNTRISAITLMGSYYHLPSHSCIIVSASIPSHTSSDSTQSVADSYSVPPSQPSSPSSVSPSVPTTLSSTSHSL